MFDLACPGQCTMLSRRWADVGPFAPMSGHWQSHTISATWNIPWGTIMVILHISSCIFVQNCILKYRTKNIQSVCNCVLTFTIRLDVHYWLQNNYNDVIPGFSSYRRKDLHLMLISLSVSSFWNNKCHIICKASTTTAVHALAGGFRTFSTLASCLRQCWYSHILPSIR